MVLEKQKLIPEQGVLALELFVMMKMFYICITQYGIH